MSKLITIAASLATLALFAHFAPVALKITAVITATAWYFLDSAIHPQRQR